MNSKFDDKKIPAKAGLGLRSPHYQEVMKDNPDIAWFEVHSENFFAEGGMSVFLLEQIREKYPVSFHGVGLSLGASEGLDVKHLEKLKKLVDKFNPGLLSEHISWSNIGGNTLNDLLPLPYTKESLACLVDNIKHFQDFIGRNVLIENPSSYLEFNESTMSEWEFINEAISQSGCGLLLDVNNIFVSCENHGWDSKEYIKNIPYDAVGEIHLAGYEVRKIEDKSILIDTHGERVYDEVWELYERVIDYTGCVPTLIEWDTNVPELSVLLDEADKAQNMLNKYEAKNAVA